MQFMQFDPDYCPSCQKTTYLAVDRTQGTLVCKSCGRVVEDKTIDYTPEHRKLAEEYSCKGDKARIGGIINVCFKNPLFLYVSGTASSSTVFKLANRLGSDVEDRNLIEIHQYLIEWGSLLNLQRVIINKAEQLFFKVKNSERNFKGRSIEAIAAAILYISAKIRSIPVNPQDIENVTGIPLEDIKRGYKVVRNYVEYIPPSDAPKYCSKFCVKLNIPPEFSSKAIKIAEFIKERGFLDGSNPRTIASVAIYNIMLQAPPDCGLSLVNICRVSEISESTIERRHKEISKHLMEIIFN